MVTTFNEDDTVWAPPNRAVNDLGAIYDNIQDAVDEAGNLVLVGPGTFEESVSIDSDSTALIGSGRSTLIDGGQSDAINPDAQDITISDVAVKTDASGGGDGVNIQNSAGDPKGRIRVFNVTVEDAGTVGIRISSNDSTVTNCMVKSATADGVRIDDSGIILSNTQFFEDIDEWAIESTSDDADIDTCIIRSSDKGVLMTGTNTTADNIRAKNVSTGPAIKIEGNSTSLDGSIVTGSGGDGIEITAEDVAISDTVVTDSVGSDINDSLATAPRYDAVYTTSGEKLGDGLTYDDSSGELSMNVVASGSTSLSSGAATIDTGVSESTTATFYVALGPDTDDAEVSASIQANSGGNYEVHLDEVNTEVGNPTVDYDIIRVR